MPIGLVFLAAFLRAFSADPAVEHTSHLQPQFLYALAPCFTCGGSPCFLVHAYRQCVRSREPIVLATLHGSHRHLLTTYMERVPCSMYVILAGGVTRGLLV